jgi:hypothetical protein
LRRHNTVRLSTRLSCEGKNLSDATSICSKIKDFLGDLCLCKDDEWDILRKRTVLCAGTDLSMHQKDKEFFNLAISLFSGFFYNSDAKLDNEMLYFP